MVLIALFCLDFFPLLLICEEEREEIGMAAVARQARGNPRQPDNI
jgi:hypothetical protein